MRLVTNDSTDEAIKLLFGKKLIGRRVAYVRCTGDEFEVLEGGQRAYHRGGIYVPDYVGDWSNFGTIFVVGADCKYIREEHLLFRGFFPEVHPDLHRVGGEVFIASEDICSYLVPPRSEDETD